MSRRGECRGSRSACADLDGTNASGLWPLAAPKPARVPLGDRPTYSSGEGLQ
jgi:hypothetical protein